LISAQIQQKRDRYRSGDLTDLLRVGRVLRRRLALTSRFEVAITTHNFVGLYLHN